MANMFDYLTWRGDLSAAHAPWCLVDSLVVANMCYNDLGPLPCTTEGVILRDLAPTLDLMEHAGIVFYDEWHALLSRMAQTVRYGGMRLHDYIDEHTQETQFSAVTMEIEDGPIVVAFRGTDMTLVGWREDFQLAFETVPAQTAAAAYLTNAVASADRPVVVVGHSKGGNLAAYAAAHLPPEHQEKLMAVCSFDGPGLDDQTLTSDGYERIEPILTCLIPHGSVVGLLLGYHRDYVIVHSTNTGLMQHDAFSWELDGPAFVEVQQTSVASQLTDRTVHQWLAQCSSEQRRTFVAALFSLLDPLGNATVDDLIADKLRTAKIILQATHGMDPEMRRIFLHLMHQLVSISVSNTWRMMTNSFRNQANAPETRRESSTQGGIPHES